MDFQKSSISVNHPRKESKAWASDIKYRERRCYPKTFAGRVLGALIFFLILSGQAQAYHKTNKFERQAAHANSDGGGWTVIYGKEFTHNDYLALGAALAADIYGGYGSATSAYLKQYADQTRQQILSEITRRAPQLLPTLSNELSLMRLLSALKLSYDSNGRTIQIGSNGINIEVSYATYNRSECTERPGYCAKNAAGLPFSWKAAGIKCEKYVPTREACISTPNTYQPYIRFRFGNVAPQRQATSYPPQSSPALMYVFTMSNITERQGSGTLYVSYYRRPDGSWYSTNHFKFNNGTTSDSAGYEFLEESRQADAIILIDKNNRDWRSILRSDGIYMRNVRTNEGYKWANMNGTGRWIVRPNP
jgi:hypothetical protein